MVCCYHLPQNLAAIAGYMSREVPTEIHFCTKEEYQKFAEVAMDEPFCANMHSKCCIGAVSGMGNCVR